LLAGAGATGLQADTSIARSGETLEWRNELLRAGVRGKSGQYIRFARLEPLLGCRWLHAEGETRPSHEEADLARETAQALCLTVYKCGWKFRMRSACMSYKSLPQHKPIWGESN
jgi:hypothetical protein